MEVLSLSRVRQKLFKDVAKKIVVNYWDVVKSIWDKSEVIPAADPQAASDYRYQMYKKIVEMVTDVNSKTVRNRIAGYMVALMKQILYLGRYSIEELSTRYKLKESLEKKPENGESMTAESKDVGTHA